MDVVLTILVGQQRRRRLNVRSASPRTQHCLDIVGGRETNHLRRFCLDTKQNQYRPSVRGLLYLCPATAYAEAESGILPCGGSSACPGPLGKRSQLSGLSRWLGSACWCASRKYQRKETIRGTQAALTLYLPFSIVCTTPSQVVPTWWRAALGIKFVMQRMTRAAALRKDASNR
jgi:hypothetical protein